MKHTPGPWRVVPWGRARADNKGEILSIMAGGERSFVARVSNENWDDESLATARLIAAAPDMLAALQFYANASTYAVRGHPQIDADTKPILRDHGEMARAAIAKAENRA